MIVCDGNYGLGAYGMDSVHNREPERSRESQVVTTTNHMFPIRAANCRTPA